MFSYNSLDQFGSLGSVIHPREKLVFFQLAMVDYVRFTEARNGDTRNGRDVDQRHTSTLGFFANGLVFFAGRKSPWHHLNVSNMVM